MHKNNKNISVGIIISTYNNPKWLEKTLWGYTNQSISFFELIIADDGSGEETKSLIEQFKANYFPYLKHVWHPDNGFQKCRILNKALTVAESDYLIFTDQDCIPRRDFIETHLSFAEKGYILSGGYYKLPMSISQAITQEDIRANSIFDLKWLCKRGLSLNFKATKLIKSKVYAAFMNAITPARATWNGCNASGWREDMLSINGFNEDMLYGGEDREFGERLFRMGVRSKQIRYSVICLHLDHKRPYKNEEIMTCNKMIRKNARRMKIIRTPNGINKDEDISRYTNV